MKSNLALLTLGFFSETEAVTSKFYAYNGPNPPSAEFEYELE